MRAHPDKRLYTATDSTEELKWPSQRCDPRRSLSGQTHPPMPRKPWRTSASISASPVHVWGDAGARRPMVARDADLRDEVSSAASAIGVNRWGRTSSLHCAPVRVGAVGHLQHLRPAPEDELFLSVRARHRCDRTRPFDSCSPARCHTGRHSTTRFPHLLRAENLGPARTWMHCDRLPPCRAGTRCASSSPMIA